MSKSNEPTNENKIIPKAYGSMSSRQQIIYIKNKTQKESEWTIDKDIKYENEEKIEESLDYHQVFMDQKEKIVNSKIISEKIYAKTCHKREKQTH